MPVHDTEISYEQLVSEFIDARVESDNYIWKQAAIAFYLKEHLFVPAKSIAGDVGYSERYITNLVCCFSAFPEENERAIDLSFSHHLEAAKTDDPLSWLELAVSNAWSVRELKNAIKGVVIADTALEKAVKLWGKVIDLYKSGDPEAQEYLLEQASILNNE